MAEIVKEAGKDAWKQRRQLSTKGVDALGKIGLFARKLVTLRARLTERTDLAIGIPFPDDFFATRLKLEGLDYAVVAAELALFVHYLPQLEGLIQTSGLSNDTVANGIHFKVPSDLSLEVSWIDARSLALTQQFLKLEEAR